MAKWAETGVYRSETRSRTEREDGARGRVDEHGQGWNFRAGASLKIHAARNTGRELESARIHAPAADDERTDEPSEFCANRKPTTLPAPFLARPRARSRPSGRTFYPRNDALDSCDTNPVDCETFRNSLPARRLFERKLCLTVSFPENTRGTRTFERLLLLFPSNFVVSRSGLGVCHLYVNEYSLVFLD